MKEDPLHDFVIECRELLAKLDEARLRIELAPGDQETGAAVARAMEAIRRAAGLIEFGRAVGAARLGGGGIERVHSAELRVNSQMSDLRRAVCDHLGTLAGRVAGTPLPDRRCA